MKLTITHLYPAELNIYGDWGNIITLRKRLEWRGDTVEYQPIHIGDDYDFTQTDIVFGGGGQDKGQIAAADDLAERAPNIHRAVEEGVVFLTVCGTFQLFGNSFTTATGSELPGVGVFDAETAGSQERLTGNMAIQTRWGELVGFENHGGKTYLSAGQSALGRVVYGNGNNGEDRFEGAIDKNVFGTYLHGPLLPKNPHFTDELLKRAIERRGGDTALEPLDDSLAERAVEVAKQRPQ
jgi:CobQ-like glutamine amidotransferase family enzyme